MKIVTNTLHIISAVIALVVIGSSASIQAVSPPPDGGYSGGNRAEGQDTLFSLTTGVDNTAVDFLSLRRDTGGAGALQSSAGPKCKNARKSASVESSASRERIGGNDIGRCSAGQAQAPVIAGETRHAPIPFTDIGAKATAGYHGDAIGVASVGEGAQLHTASKTVRFDQTRWPLAQFDGTGRRTTSPRRHGHRKGETTVARDRRH